MKSPARWVVTGVLLSGVGLAWGLIPRSEEYSDFGLGVSGVINLECGSAFSEDVDPQFRDAAEGQRYRADRRSGYDPPIFEGQTATEACEDPINGARALAIAGLAGGGLLALFGVLGASGAAAPTRHEVDESLLPPPPPGGPAPPPCPAEPPSVIPSSSLEPELASATPSQSSSLTSRTVVAVLFDDGRRVEVDGSIVIGRDPSAPAGTPSELPVVVLDATVSKTHLRVGSTGDEVWIEDLHSRNGVSVVARSGETISAVPGRRMVVDPGDRVTLGDDTSFVVATPGPPR